jgi:hypothetical protein
MAARRRRAQSSWRARERWSTIARCRGLFALTAMTTLIFVHWIISVFRGRRSRMPTVIVSTKSVEGSLVTFSQSVRNARKATPWTGVVRRGVFCCFSNVRTKVNVWDSVSLTIVLFGLLGGGGSRSGSCVRG